MSMISTVCIKSKMRKVLNGVIGIMIFLRRFQNFMDGILDRLLKYSMDLKANVAKYKGTRVLW